MVISTNGRTGLHRVWVAFECLNPELLQIFSMLRLTSVAQFGTPYSRETLREVALRRSFFLSFAVRIKELNRILGTTVV
jgi:hypothetical protein